MPREPATPRTSDLILIEATEARCRFPLWPAGPAPRIEAQFICGAPTVRGSYCNDCANRAFSTIATANMRQAIAKTVKDVRPRRSAS